MPQLSCWRPLLPNGPPWKSRMRYIMKPGRVPSKSPRGWRGPRWSPGFTCALALGVLLSGAAVAQDTAWHGFAAPLRMVNLNPFHLLYGVPASVPIRLSPTPTICMVWRQVAREADEAGMDVLQRQDLSFGAYILSLTGRVAGCRGPRLSCNAVAEAWFFRSWAVVLRSYRLTRARDCRSTRSTPSGPCSELLAMSPLPLTPSFTRAIGSTLNVVVVGDNRIGMPASFGARVMPSGSSELIASMDVASHLSADRSGADQVLMDGETYRQALTLRQGLGDGWEYLLDIPAVSHSGGALDGFIENWHRAFGLPQGQRDRTPRDRLAFLYTDDGGTRVDIDRSVFSLGDASLGVGYALPSSPFPNDGMVVRAVMKLPSRRRSGIGWFGRLFGIGMGGDFGCIAGLLHLPQVALHGNAGRACRRGAYGPFGHRRPFHRLRAPWRSVAGAPTPAPDGAGRCSLVTLQRHRPYRRFRTRSSCSVSAAP